jgi:hypothetical protein
MLLNAAARSGCRGFANPLGVVVHARHFDALRRLYELFA